MKTKVCSRCGKEKPLSSFKPNVSRPDGVQGWCSKCDSHYHKEYYKKNKARWKSKYRKSRKEARVRNREYVYSVLSNARCADCGTTDVRILEFDHVNGKKIDNISAMVSNAAAVDTIASEIDKCDIVCANCHRIRTLERQGSYRLEMGGFA
jgi:hypothetical protein